MFKAGKVAKFNSQFDKVTSWQIPILDEVKPEWMDSMSVRDDDLMYEMFEEGEGEDDDDDTRTFVMASDNVISTIMGMEKSYYSWDIIVEKEENIITLDIRTETDVPDPDEVEKHNMLNLQFTGETSIKEPPPGKLDEYDREKRINVKIKGLERHNMAYPVMIESTKLVHTLQQCQVNVDDIDEFEHPHPASESESQVTPHHGYVYKKFELGSDLVVFTRA